MKPISLHAIWLAKPNADTAPCALRRCSPGWRKWDFSHIHQPIKDVILSPQQALYRMHDRGNTFVYLCAAE